MKTKPLLATSLALTLLGGMGLAACSSNNAKMSSASTVTVSEWIVKPQPIEVKAGAVRITVKNVGIMQHEMLLYRTNANELPLKANGSVDEDAAAANFVGEISDLPAGTAKTKTFDLKLVGLYTLFCNIEEKTADGDVSHYVNGMVSRLTVSYSK